ncbi:MAG: carboxypeptidase regulatory-like domain-containing protein [Verrucomicrobiae bacterium]|nr:carboxypeptidase regulatory-like domain-containing protein [Verrucomicrobiae bacterium]
MNALWYVLGFPFVERLGWALVHFVWQGALIWAVLGVVGRGLRGRSPGLQYGVVAIGLAVCALAPVATIVALPVQPERAVGDAPATHREAGAPVFVVQAVPEPVRSVSSGGLTDSGRTLGGPGDAEGENPANKHGPSWGDVGRQIKGRIQPMLTWVVLAWFSGVMFLGFRMCAGWWVTRRWVRSATVMTRTLWNESLEGLRQRFAIRGSVRLLASVEAGVPMVIGWIRPVILVPMQLVTGYPPQQIEAILAHELAHIRRQDYLVNLLQMLVETVLFYHPVVWWLGRRMRQLREECCDDLALAVVRDRALYARALSGLVEIQRSAVAASVAAGGGSLLRRIRRLAGEADPDPRGAGRLAAGGGAMTMLVLSALITLRSGDALMAGTTEKPVLVLPAPRGTVVDDVGSPVVGAKVVLYRRKSEWGLDNGVVEETRSAAAGGFALRGEMAFDSRRGNSDGDFYVLVATRPDSALGWATVYARPDAPTEYRLRLTRPAARTIRVTDRDGGPIEGASVRLSRCGDSDSPDPAFRTPLHFTEDIGVAGALTDANGVARIENLPDTDCSFSASKAGFSSSWSGCGAGKVKDIKITLHRAGRVAGTVVDPLGRPVPAALVWARPAWPLAEYWLTRTDAEGRFELDRLYGKGGSWTKGGGTGEYDIGIRDDRLAAPMRRLKLDMGQQVDGVRIEASPGCLIRGLLLDPETKQPVPGGLVMSRSDGGGRTIEVGLDGRFDVRVPGGEVDLWFGAPPHGWCAVEDFERGRNAPPSRMRLGVSSGERDVTLYAPSGLRPLTVFSGRVSLPDGSPGPGAKLQAIARGRVMVQVGNWSGTSLRPFTADTDGYFRCESVPCGLGYLLYAESEDSGHVGITNLPPMPPAEFKLGEFRLQKASVRRVRVVDFDGKPRCKETFRVRARLENSLGNPYGSESTTDDAGILELRGCLPGIPFEISPAQDARWPGHLIDFAKVAAGGTECPVVTVAAQMRVRIVGGDGEAIDTKELPDFRATTAGGSWWSNGSLPIVRRLDAGWFAIDRHKVSLAQPGKPIRVSVVAEDGRRFWAEGLMPDGGKNEMVLLAAGDKPPAGVGDAEIPGGVASDEVAGRVVDRDGRPVTGARVRLQPGGDQKERAVETEADGAFLFDAKAIRGHMLYLQVEAEGFATRWISQFPTGRGFAIQLDKATRFTGRFVGPDGGPPGKVELHLTTSIPRVEHLGGESGGRPNIEHIPLRITTDEKGAYDFPAQPGTYDLRAENGRGLVAVAAGISIQESSVTALPGQLRQGIPLRVQAVDCATGKPVAGIPIALEERIEPYHVRERPGTQRTTDENGIAVWEALVPGETEITCYRMTPLMSQLTKFVGAQVPYQRWWTSAEARDWVRKASADFATRPPTDNDGTGNIVIDVRDGIETAVIQMEMGIRVRGMVSAFDGKIPEGTIVSVKPEGAHSASHRFSIPIAKDGSFDAYVPAGNGINYGLCAGRGYVNVPGSPSAVSEFFSSKPGDSFEFDLRMPEGGWVAGRVADEQGRPVPDIEVEVIAVDRRDTSYSGSRGTTGADGTFRIGPMRPTRYFVRTDRKAGLGRGLTQGPPKQVEVQDGGTTRVDDIVLRPSRP